MDIKALAASLTSDGDTVDLEDGDTLRLRLLPDDIDPFEWTDSFGKVAGEPRQINDYGHHDRPDGFDGNAERLHVGRSFDGVWWQPPADVKRSDPGFPLLRKTVLELLEYGYICVVVERLSGTDAYDRPIVVNVASLGAVEPSPTPEYLAEVVTDLIGQVVD